MIAAPLSPRVVLHSSDSNEWYTPPAVLAAARRVLGPIELDPASCAAANEVIQAERYYTIEDDGLSQPWRCRSLWLNPPYGKVGNRSNQDIWSQQLVKCYRAGDVDAALLLVNAATDTAWFQTLGREFPVCLIAGRLKFWRPNVAADNPTHGNALAYLGPWINAFAQVTRELGIPAGAWQGRAS